MACRTFSSPSYPAICHARSHTDRFLIVYLHVLNLFKHRSAQAIRESIQVMPVDLHDAYDKTLQGLRGGMPNPENLDRALLWISCCVVDWPDVHCMFTQGFETVFERKKQSASIQYLQDRCSVLVRPFELFDKESFDEDSIKLSFAHASVQTYLERKGLGVYAIPRCSRAFVELLTSERYKGLMTTEDSEHLWGTCITFECVPDDPFSNVCVLRVAAFKQQWKSVHTGARFWAARRGLSRLLDFLLDLWIPIIADPDQMRRLLRTAVLPCKTQIVEILRRRGTGLLSLNNDYENAPLEACRRSFVVTRKLGRNMRRKMSPPGDVNDEAVEGIITRKKRDFRLTSSLLEPPAAISMYSKSVGGQPLWKMCHDYAKKPSARHPLEQLQGLLSSGGSPNTDGNSSCNALHEVLRWTEPNFEALEILLEHGASVSAHSQRFGTPLPMAIARNHEPHIILALLKMRERDESIKRQYKCALTAALKKRQVEDSSTELTLICDEQNRLSLVYVHDSEGE